MELLDEITRQHPIDTNRIYATGLSMGGRGTWELKISMGYFIFVVALLYGKII
jgi:predicted peptidase